MFTITARLTGKSILKTGTSDNGDWELIQFMVEKQYRKVKRKFIFVAFNKIGKMVMDIPLKERITVRFELDCKEYSNKWYTSLKAIEVEKYVSIKKIRESMKDGADPIPDSDYEFQQKDVDLFHENNGEEN